MSEQQESKRKYEGPAELTDIKIDENSFNYGNNVVSIRSIHEKEFGEEGIGWEIVRPEITGTYEEKREQLEQRRVGREVIRIAITPDGKQYKVAVRHNEHEA